MKVFLGVARVIVWIIEAICLIAMVSLVFAFFLLLFGANPTAAFTRFVYAVAKPFLAPFATVFPGQFFLLPTARAGYVNLGIIVALAFYAVVSSLVSWVYVKLSGDHQRGVCGSSGVPGAGCAGTSGTGSGRRPGSGRRLRVRAGGRDASRARSLPAGRRPAPGAACPCRTRGATRPGPARMTATDTGADKIRLTARGKV